MWNEPWSCSYCNAFVISSTTNAKEHVCDIIIQPPFCVFSYANTIYLVQIFKCIEEMHTQGNSKFKIALFVRNCVICALRINLFVIYLLKYLCASVFANFDIYAYNQRIFIYISLLRYQSIRHLDTKFFSQLPSPINPFSIFVLFSTFSSLMKSIRI